MAAHQYFEEGQPIHARHLDVQGEHVRVQRFNFFSGDIWIARRSHYLKLRVGTKDLREQLAHQRRVVYDEHLQSSRHIQAASCQPKNFVLNLHTCLPVSYDENKLKKELCRRQWAYYLQSACNNLFQI